MPYDEARARLHLAYASREVVEQEQHRREALRLLAQLGCTEPNAEGERDGTRP